MSTSKKKEEEDKKNKKLKKINREKDGNDWYGFGIQIIKNLIYTFLFGLMGANFIFYYKVLDFNNDDDTEKEEDGNDKKRREDNYFPVKTSLYNEDFKKIKEDVVPHEHNVNEVDSNDDNDDNDTNDSNDDNSKVSDDDKIINQNGIALVDDKDKPVVATSIKDNDEYKDDKSELLSPNDKQSDIDNPVDNEHKDEGLNDKDDSSLENKNDKNDKNASGDIVIIKDKSEATPEPSSETLNNNFKEMKQKLDDEKTKDERTKRKLTMEGNRISPEGDILGLKTGGNEYKCGKKEKTSDDKREKKHKPDFPYNLFNYEEYRKKCKDNNICDKSFGSWWKNMFSYSIYKTNKSIRETTRGIFKHDGENYSIIESDTSFYLLFIFYFIAGLIYSCFSWFIYLSTTMLGLGECMTVNRGEDYWVSSWGPGLWVFFNAIMFGLIFIIMGVFTIVTIIQYIFNFTIKPLMNDPDDIKNILKCNVHTLILFFCLLTISNSSDYIDDTSIIVMSVVTGLYFIRTVILYLQG